MRYLVVIPYVFLCGCSIFGSSVAPPPEVKEVQRLDEKKQEETRQALDAVSKLIVWWDEDLRKTVNDALKRAQDRYIAGEEPEAILEDLENEPAPPWMAYAQALVEEMKDAWGPPVSPLGVDRANPDRTKRAVESFTDKVKDTRIRRREAEKDVASSLWETKLTQRLTSGGTTKYIFVLVMLVGTVVLPWLVGMQAGAAAPIVRKVVFFLMLAMTVILAVQTIMANILIIGAVGLVAVLGYAVYAAWKSGRFSFKAVSAIQDIREEVEAKDPALKVDVDKTLDSYFSAGTRDGKTVRNIKSTMAKT